MLSNIINFWPGYESFYLFIATKLPETIAVFFLTVLLLGGLFCCSNKLFLAAHVLALKNPKETFCYVPGFGVDFCLCYLHGLCSFSVHVVSYLPGS